MHDRAGAPDSGRVSVDLIDVDRIYSSEVETVRAVKAVTLSVSVGEFVAVMGPSGCGKSTLLNLIAGIDVPSSGRVIVAGSDIGGRREAERTAHRLRTTGVIFQEHRLLPELTACENVMLPLEVMGRAAPTARSHAEEALARTGLAGLGARFPDQLSGGQRQRVGIARGIVGGRRLLLADEATGALDSETSESIYALLSRLAEDGCTVIAATHDPEATRWVTRVVQMRDGAVVADQPTATTKMTS
ncbi:MAG: ABC transporter ATP-binding protein [Actinomycetia bacterium]|nr:ABC transporter ATP-binding protein [Actinomycetes bacterium]